MSLRIYTLPCINPAQHVVRTEATGGSARRCGAWLLADCWQSEGAPSATATASSTDEDFLDAYASQLRELRQAIRPLARKPRQLDACVDRSPPADEHSASLQLGWRCRRVIGEPGLPPGELRVPAQLHPRLEDVPLLGQEGCHGPLVGDCLGSQMDDDVVGLVH
jgi:hypothetical protein